MHNKVRLELSKADITAAFNTADLISRFPPVLTVEQAAALLQVPKATIYDWSSRGRLRGCSRRMGKHLRIWRDRLLQVVFNSEE